VHAHAGDVNGVVTQLANRPYIEMIRTRNPFGWVDHRKLVLVDGRCAWTGGRNFTPKSFFEQRDLSATLEGPLVAALAKDFEAFWEGQGGAERHETGRGPLSRVSCLVSPVSCLKKIHAATNYAANVRPVYTLLRRHQIEQMMYHVVDRAQHHIYLEN